MPGVRIGSHDRTELIRLLRVLKEHLDSAIECAEAAEAERDPIAQHMADRHSVRAIIRKLNLRAPRPGKRERKARKA
jgi:hypothetical protein